MGTSYSACTWLLMPVEPSELLIVDSILETVCDHPQMTEGMRFCPVCATPADKRTEEKQVIKIRSEHLNRPSVDNDTYDSVESAISDIVGMEYSYGREGAIITKAEPHAYHEADELFLGIPISDTDYDNHTVDVPVQRVTDRTLALMRTAQMMGLPEYRPILHRTLLQSG